MSSGEDEVFHGSFGELLVDFFLEVFKLLFDLLVGWDFSSGWNRKSVRVLSRDVINAPRLQIEHYLSIVRTYS